MDENDTDEVILGDPFNLFSRSALQEEWNSRTWWGRVKFPFAVLAWVIMFAFLGSIFLPIYYSLKIFEWVLGLWPSTYKDESSPTETSAMEVKVDGCIDD